MTYRNRALLDIAHEAPCMFRIPGVCQDGLNPCVPCHSNMQRHERGHAHKSADIFAPAGCTACHDWYDRGRAPRDEKENALLAAIERWWTWLWTNGKVRVA